MDSLAEDVTVQELRLQSFLSLSRQGVPGATQLIDRRQGAIIPTPPAAMKYWHINDATREMVLRW